MPVLGTTDYSPILRALQGRGQAQGANLQMDYESWKREQEKKNTAMDLVQAGTQLASNVYSVFNEAQFSDAKKKASARALGIKDEAANDVAAGNVKWDQATGPDGKPMLDPNGNPVMKAGVTDERQAAFDAERDEINKKYRLFPEVRQWALAQLDARINGYTESVVDAQNKANQQAIALNDASIRTQAMDTAIKAGDFSVFQSALDSQTMSPGERSLYTTQGQAAFDAGRMTEAAKAAALSGGLSALDASVDGYTSAFGLTITDDQKAVARKAGQDAMRTDLSTTEAIADEALKAAYDSGAPMGLSVQGIVDEAHEWQKPTLQAHLGQKRDGMMWEQFQGKFTGITSFNDALRLWESIKYNEPGNGRYTGQYVGAQEEQQRELSALQSAWGIDENGLAVGGKGENPIAAGIKTEFLTTGLNLQQAVKLAKSRGIWDSDPQACTSLLQYMMNYDYPDLASTFSNMKSYVGDIAKKNKLSPDQENALYSLMNDTVRQAVYDNPKMSASDVAALEQSLVSSVVGKGASLFTSLAQPGLLSSTDDALGKFYTALKDNPTLANAAVYTKASFDSKDNYETVINPFMAPKIQQLADRGRGMLVERLGVGADDVVQSFQAEGAWDVSALPQYTVAGKDGKTRTFVPGTDSKGALTMFETTDGQHYELTMPKSSTAKPAASSQAGAAQAASSAATAAPASPNFSTVNKQSWFIGSDGTLQNRKTMKYATWDPTKGSYVDSDGNVVDVTK